MIFTLSTLCDGYPWQTWRQIRWTFTHVLLGWGFNFFLNLKREAKGPRTLEIVAFWFPAEFFVDDSENRWNPGRWVTLFLEQVRSNGMQLPLIWVDETLCVIMSFPRLLVTLNDRIALYDPLKDPQEAEAY